MLRNLLGLKGLTIIYPEPFLISVVGQVTYNVFNNFIFFTWSKLDRKMQHLHEL